MAPGEGETQECRDRGRDRYTKPSTQHRDTGQKYEKDTKYMQARTERIPEDQDTDPERARSEFYTQTRDTHGYIGTCSRQAPEPQPGSPQQGGTQSWFTGLTNLEIGISSQGFIDQPVTLRIPWAQVHDVTLGLFISQGDRWKLARSRRKQG